MIAGCGTEGSGIEELISALNILSVQGVVSFDRPAPVRRLPTAALRGLSGHLLTARNPSLTGKYFKPGQGNDIPPAYLFQALSEREKVDRGFSFRIVTWDRGGELLPALMEGLGSSAGCSFAETGARVSGVEFGPMERLCFSGVEDTGLPQKVVLRTPVRIKRKKRNGKFDGWVGVEELTLGHIVKAAANRLNTLSKFYGGGVQIDPIPFMAEASMSIESSRNLKWVSAHRRSSSQSRRIELSGIVGIMNYPRLSPGLLNLLSTVSTFHIGRHTPVGCGYVSCRTA